MGYKFQFITLAGFHSLNYSMFNLAHGYARNQMSAYVELQEAEFSAADKGFTAVKHQREVGVNYFDAVTTTIEKANRCFCWIYRRRTILTIFLIYENVV